MTTRTQRKNSQRLFFREGKLCLQSLMDTDVEVIPNPGKIITHPVVQGTGSLYTFLGYAHANVLIDVYTARKKRGDLINVFVGDEEWLPGSHVGKQVMPPSSGGYHRLCEADYTTARMMQLLSIADAEQEQAFDASKLDEDELLHIAETHPAWPAVTFAVGFDAIAACRLLCFLGDPRWKMWEDPGYPPWLFDAMGCNNEQAPSDNQVYFHTKEDSQSRGLLAAKKYLQLVMWVWLDNLTPHREYCQQPWYFKRAQSYPPKQTRTVLTPAKHYSPQLFVPELFFGDNIAALSMDIKIRQDGIAMSVDLPTAEIRQMLAEALSYTRVEHLQGEEARKARAANRRPMRFTAERCYEIVAAIGDKIPPRLITASGFLSRVVRVLRSNGYRPRLKYLTKPNLSLFKPQWQHVRHIEWRHQQREVLEKILTTMYGRIDCPTGWGKSFLLRCLCQILPLPKIVIFTYSQDVVLSLYQELSLAIPGVGCICSKKKVRGDSVYVVSAGKLPHVSWNVDLLIADEVHELATARHLTNMTLPQFSHARRFGFSANHGDRSDKVDFELEGAFGPLIASIDYSAAVQHDCVVPIQVRWCSYNTGEKGRLKGIDNAAYRNRVGIWQNTARNNRIAQVAREFDADEQVLITVQTIAHAMNLKRFLPEFDVCYSEAGLSDQERAQYIELGYIDRDEPRMTFERRRALKQGFEQGSIKKVIATSVWNRGVDFRQLSVLIRADATSSKIADTQIPGRTSRKCNETGKQFAIVVDFIDDFDEKFYRKTQRRSRHYAKHNWQQLSPNGDIF